MECLTLKWSKRNIHKEKRKKKKSSNIRWKIKIVIIEIVKIVCSKNS